MMELRPVYNRWIPFKGFVAITLLVWVFIREEYRQWHGTESYRIMMNHESIHLEQEKELGFIPFYILYILEWFIKLFIYGIDAYANISFEREAYDNEEDSLYIRERKRYTWIKRIIK